MKLLSGIVMQLHEKGQLVAERKGWFGIKFKRHYLYVMGWNDNLNLTPFLFFGTGFCGNLRLIILFGFAVMIGRREGQTRYTGKFMEV